MVKSSDIIRQCYMNLTDAVEKFQDNWMCDKTWVRVITARYPDVINSIGFSCSSFNCVISMLASQCGTQNVLIMIGTPQGIPTVRERGGEGYTTTNQIWQWQWQWKGPERGRGWCRTTNTTTTITKASIFDSTTNLLNWCIPGGQSWTGMTRWWWWQQRW